MDSAPLGQKPFILAGVVLAILKVGIDYAVSAAFGQTWSPLYYVSPIDAPLFHPGENLGYYAALWATAVPFLAVGIWLSARRLRDAAAPAWMVALFIVPFANLLFFLALSVLPSAARPAGSEPTQGAADTPGEAPRMSAGAALALSILAGATITLGALGASVGLLGNYGAPLFIGAPLFSGFATTMLFDQLHGVRAHRGRAYSLGASIAGLVVSFVVLIAFAIEGLICLMMVWPLAVVTTLIGHQLAYAIRTQIRSANGRWAAPALLLPIMLVTEAIAPPPAETYMVETVVEVAAPPEVVWENVVAFPELPPIEDWIFRVGVAAPTGARIEGSGVGAIRRCEFTTGEFVEPIEVWDPPRELAFGVQDMPDPMREMSPYDIRPRHLDGYFRTTAGRFLLERTDSGGTRLRGRTYYQLDMMPTVYWKLWADDIVHRIHLRVLNHVARISEDAARAR
ncbi:MAG: hypothetical protein KC593_06370 [Myxococcales bacterium]|nr:hypothetical protein [Myxococcales bacterium]MCB9629592.1 hypothetical protein [Sandaracinaceae bacterium]